MAVSLLFLGVLGFGAVLILIGFTVWGMCWLLFDLPRRVFGGTRPVEQAGRSPFVIPVRRVNSECVRRFGGTGQSGGRSIVVPLFFGILILSALGSILHFTHRSAARAAKKNAIVAKVQSSNLPTTWIVKADGLTLEEASREALEKAKEESTNAVRAHLTDKSWTPTPEFVSKRLIQSREVIPLVDFADDEDPHRVQLTLKVTPEIVNEIRQEQIKQSQDQRHALLQKGQEQRLALEKKRQEQQEALEKKRKEQQEALEKKRQEQLEALRKQEEARNHAGDRAKPAQQHAAHQHVAPAPVLPLYASNVESAWMTTIEEARSDALRVAQADVASFLEKQNHEWWNPPLNLISPLVKLNTEAIDEKKVDDRNTMRKVRYQVEVSPTEYARLQDAYRLHHKEERLYLLLKVLGVVVLLLGSVFTYIRVDEWSKGYLTRWILMIGVLAIGGGSLAAYFLVG